MSCRRSRARASLVAGALLISLFTSCQHSQSRAHLPAPLDLVPGVTTRRDVLAAWGAPHSIRDEPGGRTVLTFRNEEGDGWSFVVGPPLPMAWILVASSTHAQFRSAEFFFLPDGRLETVRWRSREGRLSIVK